MSAINVNSITGRTGTHGPVLTGVTTAANGLHVGSGVSVSGISTFNNTVVGGATTELVVGGDARITGILTVGQGSVTISGDGISGITTAGITTAYVTSINDLNFPTAGAFSNRNRIINGSMQVAQRATSSTANGYVSLDRWFVNQSGGSTTFSQETFTVGEERGGLKNYAKLAVSTSSDYTHIRQPIEDVKSIPAGSITVSFDAKGTSPTGGLAVSLGQNFGSGGSTDVDIAPQTVTLTSSWQRFSLTFTIPSISGKTVGSSSFLNLVIGQFSNTSTTAWELNITGVQLELGSKATPFEHESYGQTLAKCQRYFYAMYNAVREGTYDAPLAAGCYYTTNTFYGVTHFPTTMRVKPSMTASSGSTGEFTIYRDNNDNNLTSILQADEGLNSSEFYANSGLNCGGTKNWPGFLRAVGNTSYVFFEAEL